MILIKRLVRVGKGKLYTSYYARLKEGKGVKFSISLYPPKWLKEGVDYEPLYELAPPEGAFLDYLNHRIGVEDFIFKYTDHVLDMPVGKRGISIIRELLDKGQDVTVYCFEVPKKHETTKHPYKFCHRECVAERFKKLGYESEEI